jgi:hypothetical protein
MESSERVQSVISSMIDLASKIDGVSANEWLAAFTTMKAMVIADCLPSEDHLDLVIEGEAKRLRFAVDHIIETTGRFDKSKLN